MFNEKLTGFCSDDKSHNKSTFDQVKAEIVSTMKELQGIYESLKHFPGKHNQEDHAWNAGISNSKKKRSSGGSGKSSLSSFRRSAFGARYNRKLQTEDGISSPFEASSAASAQSRALGIKNPLALMKAVTVASNLLRSWSQKYKLALMESDDKIAKKLANEFEKLSNTIVDLGQKLGDDTVAQNVYKSIIQSYQDSIMKTIPETKEVFDKYSLYDENKPDKKMAKKVEQTIVDSKKEAE
jgi:hypothetical protein